MANGYVFGCRGTEPGDVECESVGGCMRLRRCGGWRWSCGTRRRRTPVSTIRTLAIVVLGSVLSTRALQGQDWWLYRDCQLEAVLPSVPALGGTAASDVKTIHQRLSVTQELEWCAVISMTNGPSLKPAVKNTRSSQIEDQIKLPWRLRRAGAGLGLTVSGVDISIQRNGFKLSKSVTF
jgi:hypothetical protein